MVSLKTPHLPKLVKKQLIYLLLLVINHVKLYGLPMLHCGTTYPWINCTVQRRISLKVIIWLFSNQF